MGSGKRLAIQFQEFAKTAEPEVSHSEQDFLNPGRKTFLWLPNGYFLADRLET